MSAYWIQVRCHSCRSRGPAVTSRWHVTPSGGHAHRRHLGIVSWARSVPSARGPTWRPWSAGIRWRISASEWRRLTSVTNVKVTKRDVILLLRLGHSSKSTISVKTMAITSVKVMTFDRRSKVMDVTSTRLRRWRVKTVGWLTEQLTWPLAAESWSTTETSVSVMTKFCFTMRSAGLPVNVPNLVWSSPSPPRCSPGLLIKISRLPQIICGLPWRHSNLSPKSLVLVDHKRVMVYQ